MGPLAAAGVNMLGNIGASVANSAVSSYFSKSLMRYQSKLNRKDNEYYLLHNPGFQRQGLEDAGYNPMLAFGMSSAQPAHVGLGSSSLGSGGDSFIKSFELANAKESLKVQKEYNNNIIDNQRADIENKKAQTQLLQAEADEKRRSNMMNETLANDRLLLDARNSKVSAFRSLYDAYLQYRAQQAVNVKGGLGKYIQGEKNYYPSENDDDFIRFFHSVFGKFGYVPTPDAKKGSSSGDWVNFPWRAFPLPPSSYDPSMFRDSDKNDYKKDDKKDDNPLVFKGFKQPNKAPKGSDRNPDTRKKQIWWKILLDSVKYVRPFPL